jgi:uncharacterized protein with FMN-binding domain
MESEQSTNSSNNNRKILASFIAVLAIVIIAVGLSFANHKDKPVDTTNDTQPTPQANGSTNTPNTASNDSSRSDYKDGTYNATGTYLTPGGQESVTVSVTLKDGTIADTSLEQHANNKDTEEYQSKFAAGYKKLVIGKTLSSVRLSRVSGSSLTSQGFNNALKTIKDQAKQS